MLPLAAKEHVMDQSDFVAALMRAGAIDPELEGFTASRVSRALAEPPSVWAEPDDSDTLTALKAVYVWGAYRCPKAPDAIVAAKESRS